jgi:diamine N-acetyltransferase
MAADPEVELVAVTASNWRDCAALGVRPSQQRFVDDVGYYLCLCAYEDTWMPVAALRDGEVVGFAMWAVDDGGSAWIAGLVVDRGRQRQGIGHAIVRGLREQLIAEPGTVDVAVSYAADNADARHLGRTLGFHETGETRGTELVARWSPGRE